MVKINLSLVFLTITFSPALAWVPRSKCCDAGNCMDCTYNGLSSDPGPDAVCGGSCVSTQSDTDIGYTCFGCVGGCPASNRITGRRPGVC